MTTVGTFLSMHLSTSEASASSQPPTTITPAGFLVHSASTVVMKAARSTEVGPAMRTLTLKRLLRGLEARIDALDEERQVRGVADPDIFLVGAARDRRSERPSPVGASAQAQRSDQCKTRRSGPMS